MVSKMYDFTTEAMNAIKSKLAGLPSFCRLTIYELLSYCDYESGIISISTLDEVARNDFQVVVSPGRKKEEINGDTLRNAFRTIKKAKPDQFIFSMVNQRIVIEMPFIRELYESFYGKSQEVAADVDVYAARPTTLSSIDEGACFEHELIGEDVTDVAAASFGSIKDINNKTNKNKLTNFGNHFFTALPNTKQPINPNFYPDAETIAKALSLGFERVNDADEIAAFIEHNQSRNTQWANFNPVYLQWLSRGAEYKKRQQQLTEQRSKQDGYRNARTYQSRKTPLELVIEQNPDAVSPSGKPCGQSFYSDTFGDHAEHGVVVDGVNELIRRALYEQERREAERLMA